MWKRAAGFPSEAASLPRTCVGGGHGAAPSPSTGWPARGPRSPESWPSASPMRRGVPTRTAGLEARSPASSTRLGLTPRSRSRCSTSTLHRAFRPKGTSTPTWTACGTGASPTGATPRSSSAPGRPPRAPRLTRRCGRAPSGRRSTSSTTLPTVSAPVASATRTTPPALGRWSRRSGHWAPSEPSGGARRRRTGRPKSPRGRRPSGFERQRCGWVSKVSEWWGRRRLSSACPGMGSRLSRPRGALRGRASVWPGSSPASRCRFGEGGHTQASRGADGSRRCANCMARLWAASRSTRTWVPRRPGRPRSVRKPRGAEPRDGPRASLAGRAGRSSRRCCPTVDGDGSTWEGATRSASRVGWDCAWAGRPGSTAARRSWHSGASWPMGRRWRSQSARRPSRVSPSPRFRPKGGPGPPRRWPPAGRSRSPRPGPSTCRRPSSWGDRSAIDGRCGAACWTSSPASITRSTPRRCPRPGYRCRGGRSASACGGFGDRGRGLYRRTRVRGQSSTHPLRGATRPRRPPRQGRRGSMPQSDSFTPPLAMNPSVGAQISANVGEVRAPSTTGA